MQKLTPQMELAVDAIESIPFSRDDLGNLLEEYLRLLSRLDGEGLYDSDQIQEINADTTTNDELLRLEKAFESEVTLAQIESVRIDPPLSFPDVIVNDLKQRVIEIIFHAPLRKYIDQNPDAIARMLAEENLPKDAVDIRGNAHTLLQWLDVGLYRRTYAERIEAVLYGPKKTA